MKKILLLILTLVTVSVVHAHDYPYLAFRTVDGSLRFVSVASLTLTVSDGNLVVRNADGETSFQLDNLDAMYFTSDATGITISTSATQSGEMEVISVSGTYVGKFASVEDAKEVLPDGIYIIRHNGTVKKIVVR